MLQEPTLNSCLATPPTEIVVSNNTIDTKMMNKYKNFIVASGTIADNKKPDDNSTDKIDQLLEKEKQNMNSEPWNKLDKRLKIQKLHAYAEKYGHDNSLPMKEIFSSNRIEDRE